MRTVRRRASTQERQQRGPGRAVRYAQVDKLLVERNSQRSIVRATGVSRTTVAKLVKKAQLPSTPLPRLRPKAQRRVWEALELDEMWTLWSSGARSGFGWPSSAPAGASWLGCWAAATRPRPGACGKPCPSVTAGIAGTSPTCSRPTWARCRVGGTAAAPRATTARASSKPLTVPCASAAVCSSGSPAPLARA